MLDQTAVITGASGGIGSAVAKKLASEGYTLALFGNHSSHALEQTAKECRAHSVTVYTFYGDLGNADDAFRQMDQAAKALQHVDLLVNGAGISQVGLATDVGNDEWLKILHTNLSSQFYCCQAIIPYMVHEKKGRILNLSSIWGNTGASCEVAYSTTKGGVNALTKSLAKELAPSGIAVNALACGMIDTPMNSCFTEEDVAAICEEIPAGRMGTPEEAAEMISLLAKAPVYLTGQIITMDGGWY